MSYTLEQFAADCRTALQQHPGPEGRNRIRGHVERACADAEFVQAQLGPRQRH